MGAGGWRKWWCRVYGYTHPEGGGMEDGDGFEIGEVLWSECVGRTVVGTVAVVGENEPCGMAR